MQRMSVPLTSTSPVSSNAFAACAPRYSRIAGCGSYLPERVVTNADWVRELAGRGLESSAAWIVERTGIMQRHFAAEQQATSDLALIAAQRALAHAQLRPQDLDVIIVATSTPDLVFPSTATIVQRKLGVTGCPAFDVQAVCAGFIYALTVADAMIRAGNCQNALVLGAETFSRLLDGNDRSTCVLFGDGAGAFVLQASATPGILASDIHADGRYTDILCVPGQVRNGAISGSPWLRMDGPAVFKLAVAVLAQTARTVLAKAGIAAAQLDWLVPHQANIRIMQASAKKLHLRPDQVLVSVDRHGNTSAASIPLAFDLGVQTHQVQRGHRCLLEGVGGGFAWGSVLLQY